MCRPPILKKRVLFDGRGRWNVPTTFVTAHGMCLLPSFVERDSTETATADARKSGRSVPKKKARPSTSPKRGSSRFCVRLTGSAALRGSNRRQQSTQRTIKERMTRTASLKGVSEDSAWRFVSCFLFAAFANFCSSVLLVQIQ